MKSKTYMQFVAAGDMDDQDPAQGPAIRKTGGSMRWSELRAYIDEQIHKQGGQDPVVEYIDIYDPDLNHAASTPDVMIDNSDDTMAII